MSLARFPSVSLNAHLPTPEMPPRMWCSSCQQDVPAVAHPGSDAVVCARCQHKLRTAPTAARGQVADHGIDLDAYAGSNPSDPPVRFDDWETKRQAKSIQRTLRRFGSVPHVAKPSIGAHHFRFDRPASFSADMERLTASVPANDGAPSPSPRTVSRRSEGGQWFAWLTVSFGMCALLAGVGTLVMALRTSRGDLWDIGLATTFAAQGLLIFGLVNVLSRLWSTSRQSSRRLHEVDSRLMEVQRTADSIAALRHSGAPAFYADLVRGASPQTLLANLKGQLDQLALRLHGDY